MKSKEVLKLLQISRVTLSSYVKSGLIKATRLPNGYYNYHDDSVFAFVGRNRYNVIYSRISAHQQKRNLEKQTELLFNYCLKKNIDIGDIFFDISSGIDLERPEFSKLLELIFDHQIDTVYVTYKDRLTQLSFSILESIFLKFGTKIIAIYDEKTKNDYTELFDEITSLMNYFSAKKNYSKHNKKNLIKK